MAVKGRLRQDLMGAQEIVAAGLSDKSVKVHWDATKGPTCDVEKKEIHMPPMPEEVPDEIMQVVRGYVDTQTGSLIHRKQEFMEGLAPTETVLAHLIETGRTNRAMGQQLYGCKVNIEEARKACKPEIEAQLAAMEAAGKAGIIGKAMVGLSYLAEGMPRKQVLEEIRADAEVEEVLDLIGDIIEEDLPSLESTKQAVDSALKVHRIWRDFLIDPPEPPPPPPGRGGKPKPDSGSGDGSGGSGSSDEDEDDGDGGSDEEEPEDEEEEEDDSEDGEDSEEDEEDSEEEEEEEDEDDSSDGGADEDEEEDEDDEEEEEEEVTVTGGDLEEDLESTEDDDYRGEKAEKETFDASEDGVETKESGTVTTGYLEDDERPEPTEAEIRKAEEILRKAAEKAEKAASAELMGAKVEMKVKPGAGTARGKYIAYTGNDKEVDVAPTPNRLTSTWYKQVRRNIAFLRTKMQLDLMGTGKLWLRYQDQGRIDGNRLAQVGVGNDRIFKRRLIRPKINSAMCMLVDLSGSMSGPKVTLALQLAMAFSEACELLDVPNEVLGFTTDWSFASGGHGYRSSELGAFSRWEPLKHLIIKPFDKRFQERKDSFANAAGVGLANNVDGEAVLWAARRLAERAEEDLRLIVLSDGWPAASGCDHSQLRRHTKMAAERVMRSGINCVGIGIQSDAVQEFYPDWVVVNELDELMSTAYAKISSYFSRGPTRVR